LSTVSALVSVGVGALTGGIGCGAATRTVTVPGPARTVTVRARSKPVSHTAPLPRIVQAAPRPVPRLDALVPVDARAVNSWTLPAAGGVPEQLVVSWERQTHPDDYTERALVIWQRSYRPRSGATWRRIYSLDAYRYGAKVDVLSITTQLADVTGDGHLDVLAYQYSDGSGACGTYDVLATVHGRVHNLYDSMRCLDDAVIGLRDHALVIDRGLARAPHSRPAHPTFSTWRRTIKRWNGAKLATFHRSTIRPAQRVIGPYGR
jgi:hypothetical protein